MGYSFIRGDTKNFTFKIKRGGEYIDGSIYTEIEVQFNKEGSLNSVKKLKSKNEVEWDSNLQHFSCFLSEEDTFKLLDGRCPLQVRLYVNNNTKGTIKTFVNVGEVLSKEVLGK